MYSVRTDWVIWSLFQFNTAYYKCTLCCALVRGYWHWQWYCHEFSSAQDGIYALGKAPPCLLRSFPNVPFETAPMLVWLMTALSRPLMEDHWALPLSTPLSSQAIDGVMSLGLCTQVVSQAPQYFRSSEMQATYHDWHATDSNQNVGLKTKYLLC